MSSRPNAPTPAVPGVELLEVIGSGGSGVVYRGRQAAIGRDVAVKVATAGAGAADEAVARWEREVAAIGAKLAGTLATVHAAGVLHRDVKPDNVLWSPHGEPQLTDFGIARLQDITTTLTGNLHATIAYAAPEVLAGQPATEAADVYGLGATLYACLTGAPPHPAESGQHVAALVAKAMETDPDPLPAHVPAGLAAVVERAIARDPSARHPDAATLRDDLARIVAGEDPVGSGVEHTQVLPVAGAAETRVEPSVAATAPHDPVPTPSTSSFPPERPAPPSRPAPAHGRSNGALWLGVLAVLVLAGGLLLLAAMNDEAGTADDTTGDAPADATTAPPETDAPETTAPETTAPTSSETTEPATTTTAEPTTTADGASAEEAASTAVTYLETLDADDLEEAWAMTTPRFQAQQDRESWEAFWSGHDIDVVGDPVVDLDAGTVTVPLSYDGQREDYVLDVVEQGGGWLIDGPVGD